MKPRFLIFILIVGLAVLAIFLWHRPVQPPPSTEPPQAVIQPASTPTARQNVPAVAPFTGPSPTNPLPPVQSDLKTQEAFQRYIEEHNVPINFYGQVIDQESNSLAGVDIKVAIRHLTLPDPPASEFGTTEIRLERVSGSDGRFEINGATGDAFDLESILKDGYEAEPTKRTFGSSGGTFANPVIFKMWSTNTHEQLITGETKFQIVPDGRAYIIDLSKGTISESGTGDLKVWVKRPSDITYGQRYNWSCEIDTINGGLLQETDASASMYQAPVGGYTTAFTYGEDATVNGWGDTTGTQRFYIMLNNGLEYGRTSIELEAYHNGQIPGLIRIQYAINPTGSRILR
jgi:hypothetical protein